MHDYYVNSLGSYFRLSWVRKNSVFDVRFAQLLLYAARQGDPQ